MLDLNKLWSEFLAAWPTSRVHKMSLEEYTNTDKNDAFVYWVESRLEKLGSIWGGSAFKFGIYCRDNKEAKDASGGRVWGDKYGWLSKFGTSEQEAFAAIRTRLTEIVDAAAEGKFEVIEEVDLAPTLKWKVAFLYQDRESPTLFPIFKKEALFLNYQTIDPQAKLGSTPYHVMYETLMERHAEIGDVFEVGHALWKIFDTARKRLPRAWAVPLSWTLQQDAAIEQLCTKVRVEPEDVDSFLDNLLTGADMSEGDHLVLLTENDVRAISTLTNAEPGQFCWDQIPVNFASNLLVNPTSEVRLLSAAEWKEISDNAPEEVANGEAEERPTPVTVSAKSSDETGEEVAAPPSLPCAPQNIILYGPPGTGKTYSTVRRALELILGPEKIQGLSERGLTSLFREHQARGQIEFVTFHQAYGYEEFVEGLRPVLDEAGGGDVRYELHQGVFKRIALLAAAEGLRTQTSALEFDELWNRLLADIQADVEVVAQSQSGKSYLLSVSSQGNINTLQCEVDAEGNVTTVSEKRQVASKRNSKRLWEARNTFDAKLENLTYQKAIEIFDAGNHYGALWIVYGRLLALSRNMAGHKEDIVDKPARVQNALDRPTVGGASFAFSAQSRQYVLIIDEINRGNISKILGELITLLEPDKRLGTRSELKLPLSYSPTHRFAVPPNLHVLGTMNTADRSIALMDVALRRRFSFEELMPDANVIREVLRKNVPNKPLIDLVIDVFDALNARIRFLYDRDHQLGHSFFLDVESLDGLRRVFVDRVIPLLQEYFYGAWDKICMVLGCPYDEAGDPRRGQHLVTKMGERRLYVSPIIRAGTFSEVDTIGFDHEEYEDRVDFSVAPGFAGGSLKDYELARVFLGVLQVEKHEYDARYLALAGPEERSAQSESSPATRKPVEFEPKVTQDSL